MCRAIAMVFAALIAVFHYAPPTFGQTPALNFSSPVFDYSDSSYCMGFQFDVKEAIEVVALGFYDAGRDGLTEEHAVGIFDPLGNLLASTSVSNSDPLDGFFRYHSILALRLDVGVGYRIGAVTGTEKYTWNPDGFATDPRISYVRDRWTGGATTLVSPEGTDNLTGGGYFGPNMIIRTAREIVPVPLTPIPNAIALTNATADSSNFQSVPSAAINGLLSDGGWTPSHGKDAVNMVVETVSDAGYPQGSLLTFYLHQGTSIESDQNHHLGRFRLFSTTDERSTFADGLPNAGDVTANWNLLEILSGEASNGGTFVKLPDGSWFVAGGTGTVDTVYTITAATQATNITGFRLEALSDPRLPSNGPGRSETGDFQLQEFVVAITPQPANSAPLNFSIERDHADPGGLTLRYSVPIIPRIAAFRIETSTDLNTWSPELLLTNLTGVTSIPQRLATNGPTRFFHIVPQTRPTVFVNLGDPLLARTENDAGGQLEFYGERDTNGVPTRISLIRDRRADGKVMTTSFDTDNRVYALTDFNDVSLRFNWQGATGVVVTVRPPGSNIAVSVPVDRSTGTVGAPVLQYQLETASQQPSKLKKTANNVLQLQNGAVDGRVIVTQCGQPIDNLDVARVWVHVKSRSGSYDLPAVEVGGPQFPVPYEGPGVYRVQYPLNRLPSNLGKICNGLNNALNVACDSLSLISLPQDQQAICVALSAAAAFIPPTSADTFLVYGVCRAAFPALETYCSRIAFSPVPTDWNAPVQPNPVGGKLCDQIQALAARVLAEPLEISAGAALFSGLEWMGPSQIVQSDGTYPTLTVDLPAETKELEVTPIDPSVRAGQSVQLTAKARLPSGALCPSAQLILTWQSSGQGIVEVDRFSGKVTGKRPGVETVRVQDGISGAKGAVIVVVREPEIARLEIVPDPVGVPVGESRGILAKAYDSEGNRIQNIFDSQNNLVYNLGAHLAWDDIPDAAVATLHAAGQSALIEGHKEGETMVTVRADSGVTVQSSVRVTGGIASISISPVPLVVRVGKTIQTQVLARDKSGNLITTSPSDYQWEFGIPEIASVHPDGSIQGNEVGTTLLTITEPKSKVTTNTLLTVTNTVLDIFLSAPDGLIVTFDGVALPTGFPGKTNMVVDLDVAHTVTATMPSPLPGPEYAQEALYKLESSPWMHIVSVDLGEGYDGGYTGLTLKWIGSNLHGPNYFPEGQWRPESHRWTFHFVPPP